VEETGCDFIPLPETFGVWSPFALCSYVQTIADHTTACSGTSTKLAKSHFLQQLSVSMPGQCLHDFEVEGESSDFPTPSSTVVILL